MNIKPSQLVAIRHFIDNAERFFHYINRDNEVEYVNGPIQWSIELTESGVIWLRADNITKEKHWFHTYIHLNVLIGLRGKVKIYSCEGIERKYLSA